MGAALSAHIATTFDKVSGLVLMAPLYDVPDNRIKIAAVGRYFLTWLYPLKFSVVDHEIFVGRVLDYDPTINVEDPELQDWLVEATRISVSAIDEMRKMAVLGRKLWPRIRQPVIVFQGGRDPAVDISLTETLFQKLPTADKEMKLFPQAGHELMRPVEPIHDKVWQKTFEFIEEHAEIGPKSPTPLNAPSLLVSKSERK
jgi:alpha-beta hydrolase superfamily lysophospholipase